MASISNTAVESNPEKYLREIRDLQKQNNILLEKLTKSEDRKASRQKFRMVGSILMALLPYLFSLFVAWTFYTKVQNSVDSLKHFITDIPSAVTRMFGDDVSAKKDQWKEKTDLLIEKGLESTKEKTENIKAKGGDLKEKSLEYWNNL